MKCVLFSEGCRAPEGVDEIEQLCNKDRRDITVSVINEAYVRVQGDKKWVLENLNSIAECFPRYLDLVNLLALDSHEALDRIMNTDIVYVVGGWSDYLMDMYMKTGFDKSLHAILKQKVYVGSSAGSMVLGRRLSSTRARELFGNSRESLVDDYLGINNFAILPHMGRADFSTTTPSNIDEVAAEVDFPVYGMSDNCAMVIDGANQYFVGSDPHIGNRTH